MSKLGVYDTQSDYLGLERIAQHWLYRSLDKLALSSELIQLHESLKNKAHARYGG